MAWTDPRTWVPNEMVTAALMNTHIRDNLNFLFSGDSWVSVSTTPGFQNNWQDYDTAGPYGPVKYQRRGGFVNIIGLGKPVSPTTGGQPAFTMPVGYRSADIMTIPAIYYDGSVYQFSELHVFNDGQIIPRHSLTVVPGAWMSFALSYQYVVDF